MLVRLRAPRLRRRNGPGAEPAPHGRPFINVLDYGAKRDGSGSSTAAFRAAIQACAKAGGGTVFVPAGHYVSGAIELVSNLTSIWIAAR